MHDDSERAHRELAPSTLSGCTVFCDGWGVESALRQFKKAAEKAGINSDVRRHSHFEKPGARRRNKSAIARKRLDKAAGFA